MQYGGLSSRRTELPFVPPDPLLVRHDVVHLGPADRVFGGKRQLAGASLVVRAHGVNDCPGQTRTSIGLSCAARAKRVCAVPPGVRRVLSRRGPSQVLGPIVRPVAIPVGHLVSRGRPGSVKCLANELMDIGKRSPMCTECWVSLGQLGLEHLAARSEHSPIRVDEVPRDGCRLPFAAHASHLGSHPGCPACGWASRRATASRASRARVLSARAGALPGAMGCAAAATFRSRMRRLAWTSASTRAGSQRAMCSAFFGPKMTPTPDGVWSGAITNSPSWRPDSSAVHPFA